MASPEAIARWAEGLDSKRSPRANKDAKPAYKRSNAERIVSILRLSAQGHTQTAIATELGCSQQCVSQTLAKYGRNTTKDARQILEAKAADMALNIIRNGRPADQVQVLKGFKVIPEDDQSRAGLSITINGFALVGLGLQGERSQEAQQINAQSDNRSYVNETFPNIINSLRGEVLESQQASEANSVGDSAGDPTPVGKG